jgi:fructose-bisphosphate aldolase, class II
VPIATPEIYNAMLDRAKEKKFAYPAINVSSTETFHAAARGFADAGSDGIIQVSTGGGEFLSGTFVKDMSVGAHALAEFAHIAAEKYSVHIALHTDHCQADKLDIFVNPLLTLSEQRIATGKGPLFNSHMFDGSALPLTENLTIALPLLKRCAALGIILEVEAGVVGGEEDGVENEINEHLFTTNEDFSAVATMLGLGEHGRYLLAATFGNVHGSYKPGAVTLRPDILKKGQDHIAASSGKEKPFDLVFHGGSGSLLEEIRETLDYGVIKMNVDTDCQYTYTRSVADHMFSNYSGVLKVDGEVGNKKVYDPRSWGKTAEVAMAARVAKACEDLRSTGTTLSK